MVMKYCQLSCCKSIWINHVFSRFTDVDTVEDGGPEGGSVEEDSWFGNISDSPSESSYGDVQDELRVSPDNVPRPDHDTSAESSLGWPDASSAGFPGAAGAGQWGPLDPGHAVLWGVLSVRRLQPGPGQTPQQQPTASPGGWLTEAGGRGAEAGVERAEDQSRPRSAWYCLRLCIMHSSWVPWRGGWPTAAATTAATRTLHHLRL